MYKGAAEYAERYNMSIKEVVEHGIQLVIGKISPNAAKRKKAKADRLSMEKAMDFVPADENGIEALIEEKYKL